MIFFGEESYKKQCFSGEYYKMKFTEYILLGFFIKNKVYLC